ncbi:MAG: acetyl-CoA acetyltransferase [Actinomycetota bacterium]|jgi:acetyl-CoA C-acetyltransferase
MVATVDPAFAGLPVSRHEAACASGSMALLGAMADLESGRYDVALVVGAEVLRNVGGRRAGELLAVSMWNGREAVGHPFPWPCLFAEVADEYDRRWGIDGAHLSRIAELNFDNARHNPNAQTRDLTIPDGWFTQDDTANPTVVGHLRQSDCSRVTDGAAGVILASRRFAEECTRRRGTDVAELPLIKGWAHRTAPMLLKEKFRLSRGEPYVFPHLRRAFEDVLQRAELPDPRAIDTIELHDCFTIAEYAALDHLGLVEPGKVWQLIEDGTIEPKGALPVNPSGGLLGGGHPVGATGIRMLLDAAKQVSGTAGDYQVDGARNAMTFNVGGSFTTVAAFVVGVG